MTNAEKIYLQAIYILNEKEECSIATNMLAHYLKTTPAAVTDMMKKLSQKNFVLYQKYQGVRMTSEGIKHIIPMIRSYRLWKVFLAEKLYISLEEIEAMANHLSLFSSDILIHHLNIFLKQPTIDPHGNPIPDAHGNVKKSSYILLTKLKEKERGIIKGYLNHTPHFLNFLKKRGIALEVTIEVIEKISFDNSLEISIDKYAKLNISTKISENILVEKIN